MDKKIGDFDRELHLASMKKEKFPLQKFFELEQEVQLLKKQKAFLERELNNRDQKVIMFDTIIELVKADYNIDLSKKVTPERCASI